MCPISFPQDFAWTSIVAKSLFTPVQPMGNTARLVKPNVYNSGILIRRLTSEEQFGTYVLLWNFLQK